jgi:transposase
MLDPCLYACQESGVTNLQTFADGVKRDYDAIRAALETAWSNDLVAYYTSFAV